MGALLLRLLASEPNHFVRQDIALRHRAPFFHHLIAGAALHLGHKPDPRLGPLPKQPVIIVTPIDRHHAAGWQLQGASHLDLVRLPLGHQSKAGQITLVIQQQV